ncbi:MAG: zinc-binding alcohol dehydrogenase [Desulfofustis sp.]|nr:zinc-binding alcohol dehydrogenase [Desulfofustis sp.]NNK57272.1 zinc-binding alcohol dehydrogenase [Desulfofustis sp.]
MKRLRLEFAEPGRVQVVEEPVPQPEALQVLVEVDYSAISPGTEMLVYRGQWPEELSRDSTIAALSGDFSYPVSYGYACVGRVIAVGEEVSDQWLDRRVYGFQPHQSHFCAEVDVLQPIPEDIDDHTALFLASMETGVNLLLDGCPLIGELVIVFGQGIIGLLTTALLARFPLAGLITVDSSANRRLASKQYGAVESYAPHDDDLMQAFGAVAGQGGKADLVYELSGNPDALSTALTLTRFSGRVIIGSWYGSKSVELNLGSFYHRGRVKLVSSQVSTLAPELTGRWDKARRLQLAWDMLRLIKPAGLISQTFSLGEASQAYELIDQSPEQTIQVIFDYRP